jgi:DNA polymerase-1
MNSFLIVDGNSIMNRAFYGVMNGKMLATKNGIYTNAIYGFLNIYWMILEKLAPNYVAISFDLKAPTFRHELFTDYKATRKPMPDELRMQMPIIKEILNAMNVPILEIEGYEADDVLGTISKLNESKNIFTYILTGDKDSFQLISKNTSVVMPLTKLGKTEYTIYTPEALYEKYSITPEQVIEVKALMGDSSDNIPGVKGIGEKTAYSLIHQYNSIDEIYNNIDNIDITPKVKEKLTIDKEMAYTSRTLATINKDVPINVDYDECILSDIDKDKTLELFKKLEFSKFITKLNLEKSEGNAENVGSIESNKINEYTGEIKKPPSVMYLDINNSEDKNKYSQLLNSNEISYLLNTGSYDKTDFLKIDYSFLAIYNKNNDTVYIIKYNDGSKSMVLEQFSKSTTIKQGYNIKKDIPHHKIKD